MEQVEVAREENELRRGFWGGGMSWVSGGVEKKIGEKTRRKMRRSGRFMKEKKKSRKRRGAKGCHEERIEQQKNNDER